MSILSARSKRLRAIGVVVLGLVLGATASWVSGELAVSWIYVVIDAAQVVGAAVMTVALVEAWRRRLLLQQGESTAYVQRQRGVDSADGGHAREVAELAEVSAQASTHEPVELLGVSPKS